MVARVLGLGAPVGDDAVGLAVVRELAARRLPEVERREVELHEVAEPSGLVPLLDGAEAVVLVDAVLAGPAGEVRRLALSELASARALSTHGLDVARAVELARVLAPDTIAPRIEVVAVGIERATPLGALSKPVARAVPLAADAVLAALREPRLRPGTGRDFP